MSSELGYTVPSDANLVPLPAFKPGVQQVVAFNATALSAALGAGTFLVSLQADQACHVAFGATVGASVTATDTGTKHSSASGQERLAAGVVLIRQVVPGTKIAAIKQSGGSAGNLWITENAAS